MMLIALKHWPIGMKKMGSLENGLKEYLKVEARPRVAQFAQRYS